LLIAFANLGRDPNLSSAESKYQLQDRFTADFRFA